MVRRPLRSVLFLGAFAIGGCTALLGDFEVGSSSSPGAEAGTDATDGSPPVADAPASDAPRALACNFVPSSFRKVVDLSTNAPGDRGYSRVAVVSIGGSGARIIPQTGGVTSDTLNVYTIRTDRPADAPNVTTQPQARMQHVAHRRGVGGGEVDIVTSTTDRNVAIYSLPDDQSSASLSSPSKLLATPPSSTNDARVAMLPLAANDFWALVELQNAAAPLFSVGTVRATGAPGTLVPSSATGNDPFSTDFINLLRIGNDVYGFNLVDVGGGTPLVQWKWPVTPSASSTGTSRAGIGNDVIPIAVHPADNGSAVEVTLGKLAFSGSTITSLELAAGTVPNASFFSFRYSDLKVATTLSDPDAFAFGPQAGVTPFPGHVAFLGRGGLGTSTGLNFVVVDVTNGKVAFSATGTGKNFLPGKDRIQQIALDYAPAQFGSSYSFDVAWTERDAGADYDGLYYQRIQCDP